MDAPVREIAKRTSATTKSKKSTVYSGNFDQHLADHHVHALYSSEEPDLDDILSTLAKPRSFLSPSQFLDGAFKTFRRNNTLAKDEDDVLANVLSTILGPGPNRASGCRLSRRFLILMGRYDLETEVATG
jgi:hypothetical protein